MILYLSSTQHTNLLDFTGWCCVDSDVSIKKMVGSFVLKQFIVYDMRNFSHFSEVVLDRLAFADSDTEFVDAIEEFLTMYSARVTVICEGLTQGNPLFNALLNVGVGNIVCDTDIIAMQREITECLSDNGMTRYNSKERIQSKSGKKMYRFECENIRIVVLSSQLHMGATTVAMGLTTWLHGVGAKVCYVEENNSGHLTTLARAYEMEQTAGGYRFDGVDYCTTTPDINRNFIVCDIGKEMQTPIQQVNTDGILLLVCGTKPYELSSSLRLKKQFETIHAFILCPFVDEDAKATYADALQNDYHKVLFLDYQPDLMDANSNAKQFKTMITKYIVTA